MASVGSSTRAGSYAKDRYRRGLRSWRARTRRYTVLVFGPFILLGLLGAGVERHTTAWAAGAVFGIGVGAWIVIRESPPAYIENWQTGAEGEQKTARALRHLDTSKWLIAHDVQTGHGNYDHIAVGPAGVFLLDSKNPIGDAYVRDGKLWLRRRHDPEADRPEPKPRNSALYAAARLSQQLRELTGARVWVQAVLVLWCPLEPDLHEDERCTILHGSRIAAWLEQQPATLGHAAVAEYRTAVQELAASDRGG